MNKEERLKALEPERVNGEIVNDDNGDGLPPGMVDAIQNAIHDFCLYECSPPVEDLKSEKQLIFTACCAYVGRKIRKYTLKHTYNPHNNAREIDTDILNILLDYFAAVAGKYNKIVTSYNFALFSGCTEAFLFDRYSANITPSHKRIIEKLRIIEYTSIREGIIDGSRNPTGGIAILNNEYWSAKQTKTIESNVINASNLPLLGENS